MIYLRQSTASQEVLLGPFVDSADGVTAETSLTIANTDIKIWKAGATTLANKNSGGATHISAGNYYAVLDATDTNTVGSGAIVVQVSGALAVRHDFVVLTSQIYDSLVAGSDLFDVSVTQIAGAAVSTNTAQLGVNIVQISGDSTAADNAESFFDGTGYAGTGNVIPTVTAVTTVNGLAANVITAAATAADFTTEIQSGLATASALATVDSNVDAILADTNELQGDWANGGRLDLILDARASQSSVDTIDSNVDAVLVDTGTTLDGAIATIDGMVDAIKAKTDSLTFTQTGHVDANVQRINDVAITGDGQPGTEFGV